MSHRGDKPSQESPGQAATDSATGKPSPVDKRSGRIAYDERGNPVWEWQLETGVYSRDISTQRLKKLDLNDLSIAETARHPRLSGGVNPYDNSSTAGGKVGGNPYNSAGRGALKPDAAGRKPVDPKKLEEWIQLRKRVEQNKREDGE